MKGNLWVGLVVGPELMPQWLQQREAPASNGNPPVGGQSACQRRRAAHSSNACLPACLCTLCRSTRPKLHKSSVTTGGGGGGEPSTSAGGTAAQGVRQSGGGRRAAGSEDTESEGEGEVGGPWVLLYCIDLDRNVVRVTIPTPAASCPQQICEPLLLFLFCRDSRCNRLSSLSSRSSSSSSRSHRGRGGAHGRARPLPPRASRAAPSTGRPSSSGSSSSLAAEVPCKSQRSDQNGAMVGL